MRSISDTINRMAALRRHAAPAEAGPSRLSPLSDFGSNPGSLNAYRHIPENGVQRGAGLVVVLHGCGQSAGGYDLGTGWSHLADEHGFVVVYPEQTNANNPHRCFNWFDRRHNRRDAGEALSIRQMIDCTLEQYPNLDPSKIFVTGLSAGGAMAVVMLATYPEVFAGGAVIAGLPYGTASSVPQAFDRMRGHGFPEGRDLEALVRNASPHEGPWPVLSVWHGSADATVVPGNADAILAQWRGLHDLDLMPSHTERVRGHLRSVWVDRFGREVIERYDIAGMGHGTPLDIVQPSYERAGAFMLDASISSTRHIAAFWNVAPAVLEKSPARPPLQSPTIRAPGRIPTSRARNHAAAPSPAATLGQIGSTIEAALRKAGLMH